MPQIFEFTRKDALKIAIRNSLELEDSKDPRRAMQLYDNIEEIVASFESLPKVSNRYNILYPYPHLVKPLLYWSRCTSAWYLKYCAVGLISNMGWSHADDAKPSPNWETTQWERTTIRFAFFSSYFLFILVIYFCICSLFYFSIFICKYHHWKFPQGNNLSTRTKSVKYAKYN